MQIVYETICMKCQSLFYEENKKDIISVSSVELAQRLVKVILTAGGSWLTAWYRKSFSDSPISVHSLQA